METKDQIKIALLAVIAGTLVIQTILLSGNQSHSDLPESTDPSTIVNQGTSISQPPGPSQSIDLTSQIQQQQQQQQQQAPPRDLNIPIAGIEFKESAWDFGKIKQNSTNNLHVFKFTNTGTNPLIIENAVGSCGCTVPKWPKEPILPGKTGVIEVDFKPGNQQGSQQKSVTITANTEPREIRLGISAFVEVVATEVQTGQVTPVQQK